ncbi:MAG: reverse transcriptase domain-containing protein [Planctomycetota bacterium]
MDNSPTLVAKNEKAEEDSEGRGYAERREDNVASLLERARSGAYKATPVRRVHIPKGTGSETRPMGIPTFEDKVLQRAVVMFLEWIYEQDFLDCAYGFRPGPSAHQALDTLWRQMMFMGRGRVLEIGIRRFFERLDHDHLGVTLRQRVPDGILLRLIDKWLQAGVLESGSVTHLDTGSPRIWSVSRAAWITPGPSRASPGAKTCSSCAWSWSTAAAIWGPVGTSISSCCSPTTTGRRANER